MKCNQSSPGFELVSPCPFPTTIIITPRAPPISIIIISTQLYIFKYFDLFFIVKGFRTIVFIFIVISTTFRSICPPAFFRCLSNSGTFTELRTTSFIETTGVACSDSVCHNRVQVLSTPVYYSTVVSIEPATFRWLSPENYSCLRANVGYVVTEMKRSIT